MCNITLSFYKKCLAYLIIIFTINTPAYSKNTQDEAEGLYNKGTVFYFGYGEHKIDKQQACNYFLEAVKLGYLKATYNLGNCYRTGDIGRVDLELAEYWYKVALEQGIESATISLGMLLLESDDPTVFNYGVSLITKASNTGDSYAQMYLAVELLVGSRLNKDIDAALCLLHKASLRENPLALGLLQLIYQEALYGVQTDLSFLLVLKERLRSIPMDAKLTHFWTYEKAIEHLYHSRPDIELAIDEQRSKIKGIAGTVAD